MIQEYLVSFLVLNMVVDAALRELLQGVCNMYISIHVLGYKIVGWSFIFNAEIKQMVVIHSI